MEPNQSTKISGNLTSTIESVLTNNGHEKKINHNDSISIGDSTPSSSSDTNMLTSSTNIIQEDPISSTSDSLTNENEINLIPTPDIGFITEPSGSANELTGDTDFFTSELNIETMRTEEISEDVEDIANDLENLLGGTAHSYSGIYKTDEKLETISTSGTSDNLVLEVSSVDIDVNNSSNMIAGTTNTLGSSSKQCSAAHDDISFGDNSDLSAENKSDNLLENADIVNVSDASVVKTERNIVGYELKRCEDDVTDSSRTTQKKTAGIECQNKPEKKNEESFEVNKMEIEQDCVNLKEILLEVNSCDSNQESINDNGNRVDIAGKIEEYGPLSSTNPFNSDGKQIEQPLKEIALDISVTDSNKTFCSRDADSKSEAQNSVQVFPQTKDDADRYDAITLHETQESDGGYENVSEQLDSTYEEVAENIAKNISETEHKAENVPAIVTASAVNIACSHITENIKDNSSSIQLNITKTDTLVEDATSSVEIIHQSIEANDAHYGELIQSGITEDAQAEVSSASNLKCELHQDETPQTSVPINETEHSPNANIVIIKGITDSSMENNRKDDCSNYEVRDKQDMISETTALGQETNEVEEGHIVSESIRNVPKVDIEELEQIPNKEISILEKVTPILEQQKEDAMALQCTSVEGSEETIENVYNEEILHIKENQNENDSSVNLSGTEVEVSTMQMNQVVTMFVTDTINETHTELMNKSDDSTNGMENEDDVVDRKGDPEVASNLISVADNCYEVHAEPENDHTQDKKSCDENVLREETGKSEVAIELSHVNLLNKTEMEVVVENVEQVGSVEEKQDMNLLKLGEISLLSGLNAKQDFNKETVTDVLESMSVGDGKEVVSDVVTEVKDTVESTENDELADKIHKNFEQGNKIKFIDHMRHQSDNVTICEQKIGSDNSIICENAQVPPLEASKDLNTTDTNWETSEIRTDENLESSDCKNIVVTAKQEIEDVRNESLEERMSECNKAKNVYMATEDVVVIQPVNEQHLELHDHLKINKPLETESEYIHGSETKQRGEPHCQSTSKCDGPENLHSHMPEDLQCYQAYDSESSFEVQAEEKAGNDELIEMYPESNSIGNTTSDTQDEVSQIVDYSAELSAPIETSELQSAVSHIVENESVENSETSELHNAISHIVDCSEVTECSNISTPQVVDPADGVDDSESFELQNAISQIIYPLKENDEPKPCELQSEDSEMLDVSQLVDDPDNASELQNAITQIIDNPLQDEYKSKDVLDLQIDHASEQNIHHDLSMDGQPNIVNSPKRTIFSAQILEDNSFEDADVNPHDNEEKIQDSIQTTIAQAQLESGEKSNSDTEVQSTMYSQPVVALMLEDMDDQLKNVIFESKSSDSIQNIPNINEVDLDTPKTFESQHMDLILREETSLLNTEDIMSEITSTDEGTIVEFACENEIKLEQEVIPETQLKITELHGGDSKDLNDVIAREIESLLELQSQDLPDDTSTIDNGGDGEAAKIRNEIILNESTYPHGSDNITEETELPENVFQYSNVHKHVTDRLQHEIGLIEQDNNYITKEVVDNIEDSVELVRECCLEEPKSFTVTKTCIEEVSSSVTTINASAIQVTDSLVTSTESTDVPSAKELDAPLVIEVDTQMVMDEKPLLPESEIVEVPTLNYSSKMSKNQDLKMTITKHKIESTTKLADSCLLDDTQSILKIYDPKDNLDSKKIQKTREATVPKLIIKPIVRSQVSPTPMVRVADEFEHTVPKLFIKNMSPNRPGSPKVLKSQKSEITSPLKLTIKPVLKPEECPSKSSPKLTIKPISKGEEDSTVCKITIKPIVKPPEEELCHSPKITIKPIIKPDDCQSEAVHSPRITIKPIPKPDDTKEFSVADIQSTRITIKPVIKPEERDIHSEQDLILKKSDIDGSDRSHSPRITIKPIIKPDEHKLSSKQDQKSKLDETSRSEKKEGSPKITIKPIVKPIDSESDSVELIDFEEQIKQERIVLKINKNSMAKESRKRDSSEEIEKLAKIKLKFSKEGGHAHIVSEQSKLKRALEESMNYDQKRPKFESDDLTITPIDANTGKTERVIEVIKDDVKITPIDLNTRSTFDDPLEKIPIFEITPESAVMMKSTVAVAVQQVATPTPRKRGRPRKVPLVVREEFKDTKEEEVQPEQPQPTSEETGRPKRSCRGPSVRTTLGIRTRRPRGAGRGRGRGRVARGVGSRGGRQQRVSAAKLKLLKEEATIAIAEQSKSLEPEDGRDVEMKEEPPVVENVTIENPEIVLIEEETRMSADTNTSRAQTPAKQVDNSVPTPGDVEDTQSSVHSTATTESTKARKAKHEVHQEPEGEVLSADQLTEYYWGGGGPYMLQEQVAQFLGIKSFKRKYPGIQRRTVDMQERDFIRESGLASEAMCDLGLTAVHSTDILDIMYSDFQHKYEEYCKHQRERQAKDFSNKQKALSLAASQEKNKHDIMQQAVQSAASWNTNFNKWRRDERKACMDLQTFTVHYPKGKFKTGERSKIGHYPVALVPGQYTDYYKTLTPAELSNLPLNTLLNKPLNIPTEEDSPSDGSGSDSDSSSSDSDSSSSDSSEEDCNICSPASSGQTKKVLAN